MRPKISPADETLIVALIARGDSHIEIAERMGVHVNSLTNIKKRNKASLEAIREKMQIVAAENELAIKQAANRKLKGRLDRDDTSEKIINKAHSDYLDGTIELKEYTDILKKVRELSINELVQISKEMHNQTTASEKPPASASDLAALAEAIKSGDEVKVTQVLFNAQRNQPTE